MIIRIASVLVTLFGLFGLAGCGDKTTSLPVNFASSPAQPANLNVVSDPHWTRTIEGVQVLNLCRVMNGVETLSWNGKRDAQGYAQGRGVLVSKVNGQTVEIGSGMMNQGRAQGPWLVTGPKGTETILFENGFPVNLRNALNSMTQNTVSQSSLNTLLQDSGLAVTPNRVELDEYIHSTQQQID